MTQWTKKQDVERERESIADAFNHAVLITGSPECTLASSPVIKQPGTLSYRVVLRIIGDDLIVHNQMYPRWPNVSSWDYSNGDYFRLDQLPQALARFAERVARQAEFAKSIYR